jgi:hypothetical protein
MSYLLFYNYCINVFSKLDSANSSLFIEEYSNNYGELSNYLICLDYNYISKVYASLKYLENFKLSFDDCIKFSLKDLRSAKSYLIESYNSSLSNNNQNYKCADIYKDICDKFGEPIPNLRLHINDSSLHLTGLLISKKIIKQGAHNRVISSPQTLARDFLRKKIPTSNLVQFKIAPFKFKSIAIKDKSNTIISGPFKFKGNK